MKSTIIVILMLIFFVDISLIAGESKKTNEYVNIEFTVKLKKQKTGTAGELLITFNPKKDIYINLEPPISVIFDSGSGVTLTGKIETVKAKEYLDISKPVKQNFKLSKNLKSGKASIKGIVSYFYCSGTDGWCSRFKQPFEVSVSIK